MPSNFDALRKGRDKEGDTGCRERTEKKESDAWMRLRACTVKATDWQRRDAVRLEDQVMMNSLNVQLIRFDSGRENLHQ